LSRGPTTSPAAAADQDAFARRSDVIRAAASRQDTGRNTDHQQPATYVHHLHVKPSRDLI
jgi:hypothetical protein